MAPDSEGVFLCDEFLGFCFFQYNLNSRFSICNSGQTLTSRLFREKIKENHFVYSLVKRRLALTCFRIAGRWSKTLDQSQAKLLRTMTPLICRLLFTSGRNKFMALSLAYLLFFYFFFTY